MLKINVDRNDFIRAFGCDEEDLEDAEFLEECFLNTTEDLLGCMPETDWAGDEDLSILVRYMEEVRKALEMKVARAARNIPRWLPVGTPEDFRSLITENWQDQISYNILGYDNTPKIRAIIKI